MSNTIETARHLLADASPELRKAVGELVEEALLTGEDRPPEGLAHLLDKYVKREKEYHEYMSFARELIEAGKQ